MGMIQFYREQVESAVKLIDIKSKYDDIKALNDINKINILINTAKLMEEFVNLTKLLDKKINEDYPEIDEMHKIASTMANSVSLHQGESCSEYDTILKDLNSDIYGILASVLLKHGEISCIKEFIESVD